MARETKNPKISLRTTAIVLTAVFVVIGAVEAGAMKVYENNKIGAQKPGAERCFKCHSDAKTIRRMREKEDGTGFLFNPDGTFKNPAFEKYNPDFKHKEPVTP